MKHLLIVLFFIPIVALSQNINGKIYDEDSTVKGALIINLTQNDTTYSDIKGNFKIKAIVNDSIMFKSLFHHDKKVKVNTSFFKEIIVFELNKSINELNEVLLYDKKDKPFEVVEYSNNLGFAIAEDIKRNPHLYMPKTSYSGGVNFIELAKLIGINKLFKKKKSTINNIEYHQLDSLFYNSEIFTDSLLYKDLKIPKNNKYLFFEYCEERGINCELLAVKENLVLLDSFYKLSKDFLLFIKEKDTFTTPGNK
ncbi:peptidase associated/transthyretin-like domain-containing protein [Seonamhaeicola aphaedonensis]|uniref:Carboxypeptidase-like protein n=1 Tax=Seonamhaeicola aphaedonensis TaxID=1461338 RepID=A0A3D9HJ67_9FLAO|nr:carboxypeptidase-like regulatory domain-containing protein [Seonamhaeicola aphaedonensis]RED49562.1 hypothetical protein DFQ02_102337 [Seonamhaeicola aphaedonensis]